MRRIYAALNSLPMLRTFVVGKASMRMIVFICLVYCALLSLFVYGWCWQWQHQGILDLAMLLNGIKEMSAPAVLAALQFFISSLHDSNNDGIPDTLQKEKRTRGDDNG